MKITFIEGIGVRCTDSLSEVSISDSLLLAGLHGQAITGCSHLISQKQHVPLRAEPIAGGTREIGFTPLSKLGSISEIHDIKDGWEDAIRDALPAARPYFHGCPVAEGIVDIVKRAVDDNPRGRYLPIILMRSFCHSSTSKETKRMVRVSMVGKREVLMPFGRHNNWTCVDLAKIASTQAAPPIRARLDRRPTLLQVAHNWALRERNQRVMSQLKDTTPPEKATGSTGGSLAEAVAAIEKENASLKAELEKAQTSLKALKNFKAAFDLLKSEV